MNGEEQVLEQPQPQSGMPEVVPVGPDLRAITNIFGIQSQRQRQENAAKFMTEIDAAGSRDKALEVVKNWSGRFTAPSDYALAFRTIDERYPEASKEVRQVNLYDVESGDVTPQFVRSDEVVKLSDPEYVKKRFGPQFTLTKPDLETFYSAPDEKGRVQVLGKMPVSKRPEGAVTLPELTEARRSQEEARRNREEGARQARFEAWLDLAERRWIDAIGKLGGSQTDQALQRGRQLLNDAAKMSVLELGGKVLPDGTFVFDDSNRAALHNQRLNAMANIAETDPSILSKATGGIELHTRAAKMFPSPAETPRPVPTPTPKKPGLLSEMFGGGTPAAKPAPAQKPAAKPAAGGAPTRENAKAQVEAAGWKYEPDKYEYGINPKTGKFARRPRGGSKK